MLMEATHYNCPRDKYHNMHVNDISEIVATTEDTYGPMYNYNNRRRTK